MTIPGPKKNERIVVSILKPLEDRKVEWESRCRHCGECCRLKFVGDDGNPIVSSEYCPALDPYTKICMIYHHRLDSRWDEIRGTPCIPVSQAVMRGIHPTGCAYLKLPGLEFKATWPGVNWGKVPWRYRLKWWFSVWRRRRKIRKTVEEMNHG